MGFCFEIFIMIKEIVYSLFAIIRFPLILISFLSQKQYSANILFYDLNGNFKKQLKHIFLYTRLVQEGQTISESIQDLEERL